LKAETGRTVILIEDMLDTDPQPAQAVFYLEEAIALVTSGEAEAAQTVLVAP